MNTYTFDADIQLLCQQVSSFPEGIKDAFDQLMRQVPQPHLRHFYGVSYLDHQGNIIYKVATSALSTDEAPTLGLELFTIPAGDYLYETMLDWQSKTHLVKDVFMKLMQLPLFDDTFPCIEWYQTDTTLLCLVRKNIH
ncbi:MAG: hypothetical protein U0Y10_13600 [Spirosomataceae bacterium]